MPHSAGGAKETKKERVGTPVLSLTGNASTSATKHTSGQQSSSTHGQTPETEIENAADEDGQDEEGPGNRSERDPLSEEIVKQLEKGLQSWPGLGEEGWMETVSAQRMADIVSAIKGQKDILGDRLATCLEVLPDEPSTSLHLSSNEPISLKQIESRTRHKFYKQTKDFDFDMTRLFEKARRVHEPGSESYGKALLLQRLCQNLTNADPPKPPYVSATNFAALRAGPGTVKPLHNPDGEGVPNVTSHRVITKDRTFVEELHYKGWKFRIADWVHLANPDDPSRPIIGQIFRCWLSDDKSRPHITVSWYYRPEQTYHTSSRVFWQNEIFKTSHFAEHPIEDVIEKIACQFTARHIRGRPRPPYWYVGFPLYVCDSRYNDRERVFVRIKNWNSCVPEEVRQNTEFMPIYAFEKIVYPVRMPSPFLGKGKGKGTGGIIGHSDVPEGPFESDVKKRAAMSASMSALTPRATANNVAPVQTIPATVPQYQPQISRVPGAGTDKSILSAPGASTSTSAHIERIPSETGKLFDRDPETNEVLWFAAPPLNQPRPRGARHSLTYLEHISAKRKKATTDEDDETRPLKRMNFIPTVTETMRQIVDHFH